MSGITDYAYINARVAAMATGLISQQQFKELAQQPLGQMRLETALDELLNNTDLDIIHIEQFWFNRLLNEFNILIRPLRGSARDFLIYWFRKTEVKQLKTVIRGKLSNLPAETIIKQLVPLGHLAKLPFEQLVRAEDILELLRQLDNTPYIKLARQAKQFFEQQQQLYALDATIDRFYLQGLVQQMTALPPRQQARIAPLMTLLLNQFNLLWLMRYRFTYQLSAAETYYLLIPSPFGLARTSLQNLAELSNLADVIAQLPESVKLIIKDATTIVAIEQHFNRALEQQARTTLQQENFTLAKVFAYVLLRELEMRRILAIIQGKRLHLSPELIVQSIDFY
jgi:V/A-type H+/Na+-transporting ATPase subunit C